ncbi:MAG: hypothetical protein LBS31_11285 [Candidatus Adiutrix sp.]|nr:hypothetical protein [Candidatus Adiutrix sp.]
MGKMPLEKRKELLEASLAAGESGNYDEEVRLMKLLPLAPHLAMIAKEMYGKGHLLENGFNLSDANEEFGDGWLDR